MRLHATTSTARQVANAAVVAIALLSLGYLVVGVNEHVEPLIPRHIGASSMPFYLIWAALCGAARLAWPDVSRIPWRVRHPPSRGDGLVLAAVTLASAFLYQNAIARVLSGFVHAPPSALALLAGGVVGPIVEEWLFRGLLHAVLLVEAPRLGTAGAIVLGSLIFGFWHMSFDGHSVEAVRMAFVHSVFGGLMALLRWRFDALLPGCIVHALGNSLTILTS